VIDDNDNSPVPSDAIANEVAALEAEMSDQHSDYWRSETKQQRLRELYQAQESGGSVPAIPSAVDTEIAEIEEAMKDAHGAYWNSPEMQARFRQLLSLRDGGPEPEGFDAPAASEIASVFGLSDEAAALVRGTAAAIEAELSDPDGVNAAVAGLPDTCRAGIVREFSQPAAQFLAATDEELAQFRKTGAGQLLVHEWGDSARQRLGVILSRWDRLCSQLSDDDFVMLDDFYRMRLGAAERAAVLRRLAE
jgi:hypothetical protein